MKFITYEYEGNREVGLICRGGTLVLPLRSLGFDFADMNDVIERACDKCLARMREAVSAVDAAGTGEASGEKSDAAVLEKSCVAFDKVKLLAPIPNPRQEVICVGVNYLEHAYESARYKKEAFDGTRPDPVFFCKRCSEATGEGGIIDGHFDIQNTLDYESEIAVIIRRDAYQVSCEDAKDYIFGYTVCNDVTAREFQKKYKQFYVGKSLDTFTCMGPWIVTPDELEAVSAARVSAAGSASADAALANASAPAGTAESSAETPFLSLDIKSFVNGELRQNSNTSLMIFDIPYLIRELSAGMTLKSGTIISTGTPSGVGMGMDPPGFMHSGDTVECYVEGIGTLTNTVK